MTLMPRMGGSLPANLEREIEMFVTNADTDNVSPHLSLIACLQCANQSFVKTEWRSHEVKSAGVYHQVPRAWALQDSIPVGDVGIHRKGLKCL